MVTQYWPPSWTIDTTAFRIDSVDIIYTTDGGAQTNASQVIGPGAYETQSADVTGTHYSKPTVVKTTIAYY